MDKSCSHCHLKFSEDVLIKDNSFDEEKFFCCKGCQGVYHLLHENGLESFYEKRGKHTLSPPKDKQEDFSRFDLKSFKEDFIVSKDGFSEISLYIEGIHCAACVWLNEKVLHKADGIIEASVNGTNHKAKILFDEEKIKLSTILEIIQSIGYEATPYDPKRQEERANAKKKEYNAKLLVAVFASMNIMWIAIAQYTGYFSGMRDDIKSILNFAEFILATPTLFYTGSVYFRGAFYGIKNAFINMDFLVATGATLAYMYSIYVMFSGVGEVYFDSVTMIVTFVFAGKYLEVISQKKAVDTLDSLTNSLPTEVVVVKDFRKEEQNKILTPLARVNIGDIIEVKAGEKVLVDGILINEEASFDTSDISGESEAVCKTKDEKIISGTICLDGVVYIQTTALFKDSMLSKITNLLEESMMKKPKIEQLANTISGYFSLSVLTLSLLTFFLWFYKSGDFQHSLIIAISVIVIACPCALGLATPVSTLVGLGVAAKRKILFKEASFLESLAKSTVLVLDKTGTITQGKPKVFKSLQFSSYDKNLLFSLLKSSNHPISKGVEEFLEQEKLKELILKDVKAIASKGVQARYGDKIILGGNGEFLRQNGVDFMLHEEGSCYFFSIDKELKSVFFLEDSPKKGAKEILNYLQKELQLFMLTGDNEIATRKIAKKLGIEKYKFDLNPLQKATFIDELHEDKHLVVMAGDGVNDAIALSKSDIAISMGSGADVALNVSDIVLLDDSLKSLKSAFIISRGTYKIIKENIIFSCFYNLCTIPLAMAGFINPLFAALSMSLSSIVVVLNAMRIKMIKG